MHDMILVKAVTMYCINSTECYGRMQTGYNYKRRA